MLCYVMLGLYKRNLKKCISENQLYLFCLKIKSVILEIKFSNCLCVCVCVFIT